MLAWAMTGLMSLTPVTVYAEGTEGTENTAAEADGQAASSLSKIDNTKWQYNETDNVYYQTGVLYCEKPADESYEKLAVFVPGEYMDASDNGDGTYTCSVNMEAAAGEQGYTAGTAPIAFTVNTPGYMSAAAITSLADFSAAVKLASKGLGAFDQLDKGQGENVLFGYGDGERAHFDGLLAQVRENEGSDYADEYAADLEKTDALGHTAEERLHMYSPLHYLMSGSDGYQSSDVAQFFRINSGLWQSDTALTSEVNLSQALENYGADVEFTTVWGLKHTEAERTGDSTANYIAWVNECAAQMESKQS